MPNPPSPSRQITMNAREASSIAIAARMNAPPKAASEGMISRKPERTITMPSSSTATAKPATRRAQMASREVGSAWMRRAKYARLTGPCRYASARAHSAGSSSGCGGDAAAARVFITATRAFVSG